MHFNFHLSGDESPEQLRKVANAVLALGGETPAKQVAQLTVSVDVDTSRATEALDKLAAHPAADAPDDLDKLQNAIDNFVVADRMAQCTTENEDGSVTAAIPPRSPIVPLVDPKRYPTEAGLTVAPSDTLDANGLPWDDRIHSSSRARNADGSWRMKRGVQEHLVKEVEHELRALTNGNFSTDPELDSALQKDAMMLEAMGGDPGPTLQQAGLLPPAPPIPPPPPVTEPTPITYANVVNLIMSKNWPTEVWWPVIGESLPAFAATCQKNPAAAGEVYDKLQKLEG